MKRKIWLNWQPGSYFIDFHKVILMISRTAWVFVNQGSGGCESTWLYPERGPERETEDTQYPAGSSLTLFPYNTD